MKVTYIDHMGDDLSVVNAARVSFNKKSHWEGRVGGTMVLSEGDVRLIKYLAKHNHWTPFAHNSITLHIKAPIFVARQLGKHQVGFVWNEVSRRYVTDPPEFYQPTFRKSVNNVKQGSGGYVGDKQQENTWYDFDRATNAAVNAYYNALDEGVSAEQARAVLPQTLFTEWYMTGNLYAWSNLYKLRTDSHTQKETQEVARQIGELVEPLFPVSWRELSENQISKEAKDNCTQR